ncbi:LysR family substrate-binding domain-containing protein [Amycolatopsis acididurans]|uniref:LysR family substrate-binding domain-containing protein n=1 Tax=Amycolatopsis acididurans TaxID=2724524 RepID=UPI001B326F2B|nr:LysR family substrate-binding domain-containing protein [Amycolatopsis acididurans]
MSALRVGVPPDIGSRSRASSVRCGRFGKQRRHAPPAPGAHAQHPDLAGEPAVYLADFNDSPLVVFPRHMASRLYDHVLTVCRDHGFMPGTIRHARNPNFIHGLVLAGLGIHLNEAPAQKLPAGLVWRPIHGEPLAWVTSTVWSSSQHSPVLADLTEAVHEGLTACGHEPCA